MRACSIGAIVMRDEVEEIVSLLRFHVKHCRRVILLNSGPKDRERRMQFKECLRKAESLIGKFERLKATYAWRSEALI